MPVAPSAESGVSMRSLIAAAAVSASDAAQQSFKELHISGRVAVSSLANLLIVFLLRLNHLLAPAIVRFFKARHDSWLKHAVDDVEEELARNPNGRQLCAGACCQVSYGTFENPEDRPSATVQEWVEAVAAATRETPENITNVADYVEDIFDGDVKQRAGPRTEGEIYFTLRIEQEKRHRAKVKQRIVDPDIVLIYLTMVALVVYGGGIIAAVQYWYRLDLWEIMFFSVSLVTVAFLAEGSTIKRTWRYFFGTGEFAAVQAARAVEGIQGVTTALLGRSGENGRVSV